MQQRQPKRGCKSYSWVQPLMWFAWATTGLPPRHFLLKWDNDTLTNQNIREKELVWRTLIFFFLFKKQHEYLCLLNVYVHMNPIHTHTLKLPNVHFWLCDNSYIWCCLVKPKRPFCMTLIRLLEYCSCWRAAELRDPPSPFLTIFILPCTLHSSPLSLPPSFVSFSLPLFFHSLSGRATCGGPSQPNPEPTGTRGSSGCNSEWIKTNKPSRFVSRGGKQCSRILFNYIESMGHVCSWEVCPCYSSRRWQKRFPPLMSRFWYHLCHWSTKFLFKYVSTVMFMEAKWLLYLLRVPSS